MVLGASDKPLNWGGLLLELEVLTGRHTRLYLVGSGVLYLLGRTGLARFRCVFQDPGRA